jgi:hypothetical protein
MGKSNRIYTREFKVEALQLLARGGKSAAELERDWGSPRACCSSGETGTEWTNDSRAWNRAT